MKKIVAILLCAAIGISVMGCGDKKEPENGADAASKYESALDVLTTVADAYASLPAFALRKSRTFHPLDCGKLYHPWSC